MAHYFFDTSALAKRYLVEAGSARVLQFMQPAANHRLWIARLAHVELVAAIARRERMGQLTTADGGVILADFDHDRSVAYRTTEITVELVERAMVLARQQHLRGYDAVQLACAEDVARLLHSFGGALTLVCAAGDLSDAARRLGIAVEIP